MYVMHIDLKNKKQIDQHEKQDSDEINSLRDVCESLMQGVWGSGC